MDKWYQDDSVGGYIDEKGVLHVCEEYDGTDADFGRYDVEVMNGNGYYDSDGKYIAYSTDYD